MSDAGAIAVTVSEANWLSSCLDIVQRRSFASLGDDGR